MFTFKKINHLNLHFNELYRKKLSLNLLEKNNISEQKYIKTKNTIKIILKASF